MTALKVVALDLSLNATGIAVTHDQVGEPRLSCRTITPAKYPTRTIIDHRRLHKTFESVAAAVQCKPDLVAVEFLPHVKGTGGVALRLAELHGALKHWLFSRGHEYVDVEPQQIKIYATGNGNADKLKVREQVTARYGRMLHVGTSDEADAVALLALALHGYGQPLVEVPPANARAVGAIDWPRLGGGLR